MAIEVFFRRKLRRRALSMLSVNQTVVVTGVCLGVPSGTPALWLVEGDKES
jgi:hypothetical protein